MVDLQSDKSIVRNLLARDEDVYIIDWGYPDRFLTLEDYIERFLGGAVDHLREAHDLDAINLLGFCQGGAFSLCYAALNNGVRFTFPGTGTTSLPPAWTRERIACVAYCAWSSTASVNAPLGRNPPSVNAERATARRGYRASALASA